jgi:hypothetical protein
MMFRNGAMVALLGVLPVVAAARFSTYGNNAYRRSIGWVISFALYKPVGATVYAAGLEMATSGNASENFMGLFLLGGAVIVLPAIMRVIVPAVTESNSVGEGVGSTLRKTAHLVYGSTAVNIGRGAHAFRPGGRDQRPAGGGPGGGAGGGPGGGPGGAVPGGPVPGGGGPGGPGGPGAGVPVPDGAPTPGANGGSGHNTGRWFGAAVGADASEEDVWGPAHGAGASGAYGSSGAYDAYGASNAYEGPSGADGASGAGDD